MAIDDDDDSLPPLGENTDKFLDQAKKGQARNFLLVCKGNKVKYLAVRKKPIKKNELNEAKKSGYKGEGYFGVITGKGMELVFNLSTADGYTAEPVKDKILKDFLEEKAEFKCKPTIAIVATLPEIPFDDEDLKNPLVARFLALDVPITQVLDINPNAEGELTQTTSEIRVLLQDADFDSAEPRVTALETRLQELLGGAVANTPAPSAPNTPAPTATTQPIPPAPPNAPAATTPTPAVGNDALKLKLQEALNKLVPQLKQAVVTYPDKKVELLTPVAQIKKQMDAGDLQEAKNGILAVGQLLKSVMAQATPQSQTESQSQPVDSLRTEYERKLAELQPDYDQALKSMSGDVGKFRAFMASALEKSGVGEFATSIKVLDRLKVLVSDALSTKTSPENLGIESGIVEKRQFLITRFRELPSIIRPILNDLRNEIVALEADNDPLEIIGGLESSLNVMFSELQSEIDTSITTGQSSALQGLKSRVLSNPLVQHLVSNPFLDGNLFQQVILDALDEVEQKLTA